MTSLRHRSIQRLEYRRQVESLVCTEKVAFIHSRFLVSRCFQKTEDHHIKRNKSSSEIQMSGAHFLSAQNQDVNVYGLRLSTAVHTWEAETMYLCGFYTAGLHSEFLDSQSLSPPPNTYIQLYHLQEVNALNFC